MKYGRWKWLYGSLVLGARDAARRFAFVRNNLSKPAGPWRPLILRWRRRRQDQAKVLTGRTAPAGPTFWFPQFHFYYATYPGNRKPRVSPAGSSPVSSLSDTRLLLDHRWTIGRAILGSRQSDHAHHKLIPFYARHSTRSKVDTVGSFSSGPPKLFRYLVDPAHEHRNRVHRFQEIPQVAGRSKSEEIRSLPFQPRLQISQQWLQVFRARPPVLSDRVPRRATERVPRQVSFAGYEELVWRRKQRPPNGAVDFEPRQVTSDRFQGPGLRTIQSQDVGNIPAAVGRSASPQVMKLDPSFVDRLTDDVIRRVEQRARIERQRRGL